jgi:hypothetical protein
MIFIQTWSFYCRILADHFQASKGMAALFHGIASGTDTSLPQVQGFYWLTGGGLLFLITAQVVNSLTL